ncbi:MAG: hypothetical protein LEGION0403_FIIPPAGN_02392 [Legionella sp.]|uniref:hypothetical protein n=1 Tax=Legionella sp. TaxID=459 RepID=UPI003D129487
MTTHNELFNFIDKNVDLSRTNKFDNCKKISKKTTLSEEIYIQFELKRDKNSLIIDDESSYQLQDHHISFYKMPKKGQYHYTAYFLDAKLNPCQHQLHVYFNEQDELIERTPIEFSKYNDETKTYQTLASENINEQFINLANNKIVPILRMLREQHTIKVERLEEEYQAQEQKSSLLSTNILGKNYLESLEKTLKILEELIALGGKSYYQSTKKLLEGSISYIKEQRSSVTTTKNKHPRIKKEKYQNNKNSIFTSEELILSKPQKKAASSSDDDKLETKINQLMTVVEALKKLSTEKQITLLKEIFSKVHELVLTCEKKELFPKIKELYKITYSSGGELLCDLIVPDNVEKNRFKLAAQLEPFHDGLNSKLLSIALDAGDHELLDFILTYKKFHINALSFEFEEGFFPSAVHFCYQISHESMIPCLAVLIKHGASVLVKDEEGLPIAYKILSTPNHPLQKAFEDNKELTIKSASFYQKLIKSLQGCLKLQNIDEPEKQKLRDDIEHYQQELKNINSDSQLPTVGLSQLSLFAPLLNKTGINSEPHEEQNKNILQ